MLGQITNNAIQPQGNPKVNPSTPINAEQPPRFNLPSDNPLIRSDLFQRKAFLGKCASLKIERARGPQIGGQAHKLN